MGNSPSLEEKLNSQQGEFLNRLKNKQDLKDKKLTWSLLETKETILPDNSAMITFLGKDETKNRFCQHLGKEGNFYLKSELSVYYVIFYNFPSTMSDCNTIMNSTLIYLLYENDDELDSLKTKLVGNVRENAKIILVKHSHALDLTKMNMNFSPIQADSFFAVDFNDKNQVLQLIGKVGQKYDSFLSKAFS